MTAKRSSGFTLIELLVVMSVLSILGTVALSIFFSVLRGANKTNKISLIRQNGNYALNQVTRLIRSGESVTSCAPNMSSLTVNQIDGSSNTFACTSGEFTNEVGGVKNQLIDKQNLTVSSCSFSCALDSTTGIPTVKFVYVVSQKSSTQLAENIASVTFAGSAQLRNTQQ